MLIGKSKITNTPYDDVFRTLLNNCSSLIIPLINEIFGENYSGKEKIKLRGLQNEYEQVKDKLEKLLDQGTISEYTRCTIIDMSNKVLEHIAMKYSFVKEGVKSVMGGKILEYETKTIKKEGIEEGIKQGIEQGIEQGMEQGIMGTVSIIKKFRHSITDNSG